MTNFMIILLFIGGAFFMLVDSLGLVALCWVLAILLALGAIEKQLVELNKQRGKTLQAINTLATIQKAIARKQGIPSEDLGGHWTDQYKKPAAR